VRLVERQLPCPIDRHRYPLPTVDHAQRRSLAVVAESDHPVARPPDPMERTVQAGLKPQPKEFLTNHVHAHLDVFVDGKPVMVPSGIGIKIDDPAVKRSDEPDGSVSYGGIDFCTEACISPLHTHDVSGIELTDRREIAIVIGTPPPEIPKTADFSNA
jgi:hypothetical protein